MDPNHFPIDPERATKPKLSRFMRNPRTHLFLSLVSLGMLTSTVKLIVAARDATKSSPLDSLLDSPSESGNFSVLQKSTHDLSSNSVNQSKQAAAVLIESLGPIFYNFFLPKDPKGKQRAVRIAEEQIKERSMSAPNSTLLYTLIGNPDITDDFCKPNCRMSEYLEQGDEIDTHQALWTYCQSNPNEIVTYIHDKGSFHDTPPNKKARRFSTKGAFECRQAMLQNPDLCNVCTGKFYRLPQYLSAANMWTVKCSYAAKLLKPKEYGIAMKAMYDDVLLHPNVSESKYACLQPQSLEENYLGIGRYASERWIFSHPHVDPCNILPGEQKAVTGAFPQKWTPELRTVASSGRFKGGRGLWTTSYSRLVGRLFEWRYIYGIGPRNSSWVWQSYKGIEDGDRLWLKRCLNKTKTLRQDAFTTMLLEELRPT